MRPFLPAFSVLLAALAIAVPWGLPADATFILPLVLVMMVFCWRTMPDVVLSPLVAMLLGLLADVMSGGPLGFWALMTLIAASVGGWARSLGEDRNLSNLSTLWLVWIGLVTGLSVLGWLIASAYFFRWIDWWPIVFGALASIVLFPVVLRGLVWIKRGSLESGQAAVYRGRT
jgi:rod shape-determining protein MreD